MVATGSSSRFRFSIGAPPPGLERVVGRPRCVLSSVPVRINPMAQMGGLHGSGGLVRPVPVPEGKGRCPAHRYRDVAQLERLQQVLRGLAAGGDPMRLLNDVLGGAVGALGGRNGMLVGVSDGTVVPLASTGAIPATVME